jgi:Holliday junction resolvase RusA-like endonuclease
MKLVSELGITLTTRPLILRAGFQVTRPRTTKLDGPKPDIDNYLKSLMDALTSAAVWDDDCQVVEVHALKKWAPSEGHINFQIEEIP